MKIISGLGNPGREYENTRHNVGFMVIDKIGDSLGATPYKFKFKAMVSEANYKGEKILLVKPMTYMNLSGEAIAEILSFYKADISDFIVVYDDISLPLSAIRVRKMGSDGGHKGIRSIINHQGTNVFSRIKVGIGEKPEGYDLADYVLSKFSKDDMPLILSGIDKACEAVKSILDNGIDSTMNKMNHIER